MKILKDFWYLIQELLLLAASILVFIPLAFVGITYTLIKHTKTWDYSFHKQLAPIIRGITLAIDGFGNSGAGELLNDIINPKIKYSKWYQTISAISGINQAIGRDSKFREVVDKVLGEDHCKKAIQDNDKCLYELDDIYKPNKTK